MSDMVSNFGFLDYRELRYGFTAVHQPAISQLLNSVSSALFFDPNGGYSIVTAMGNILDHAKSFEALNHGIMSAFLLQAHLDCVCEMFNEVRGLPQSIVMTDADDARNAIIAIRWLSSISDHSNMNKYFYNIDNFSAFLLLCDELDEFSRYSHSTDDDGWAQIRARTEFSLTKKSLNIRYTIENNDFGDSLETFFRNKLLGIHSRLCVKSGELERISLECVDIRKGTPVTLIYTCTLAKPNGHVAQKPGKGSDDIVGFLNRQISLALTT